MNNRAHIRQNWLLAYPVMLSQLGHVAMGVTDNIMVGHLGAASLAAAGLALVVFNVLLLYGIGVSYATTTLVASAHGENSTGTITSILRHGLVVNFLNSLVLVVLVSMGKGLLHHLDQPAEVVEKSIPYLSIITFSLVPMLIFQQFKQFAEGLSHTKVALVVILFANAINILLNYLLIYGHWGFEAMGLQGAGWATLFSRVFMMVAIAGYIYQAPRFRAYRDGFRLRSFSAALFSRMLHIGIPSGVQFIFEVAAFDFSLVMMGWLGTTTQAAHQIAINLATISYMSISGLAAAATIRVGYYYGKKDIVNAKRVFNTMLAMGMTIMVGWSLFFIAGRHFLPTLYIPDPDVIAIASTLLIIAALFQLADGTQVVCISALRGLQDVKIPSVLIFVAYWVIGLPLGYWLAFRMNIGAIGVWIGLLTGLTVTAVAMFIRFRRLARVTSVPVLSG